jgi:DnaJ-class molecular chaperone
VAILILAAIVCAAGYWVSLKVWPETTCKRCSGGGRNAGSNAKRFGTCKRCAGTGRRQRLGSKVVHRGAVSLAERARERKAGKR